MLLKNLINNLPKDKKKVFIEGLATNSKEVNKGYIFLLLKEIVKMEKDLLKKRLSAGLQ